MQVPAAINGRARRWDYTAGVGAGWRFRLFEYARRASARLRTLGKRAPSFPDRVSQQDLLLLLANRKPAVAIRPHCECQELAWARVSLQGAVALYAPLLACLPPPREVWFDREDVSPRQTTLDHVFS